MRVLQFYRTSYPDTMGGIEQVIHQIARGASKLGVKTDVLSLTAARHAAVTELEGYRVQRARLDLQIASTGLSVAAFRRFAQLAKQVDLIHYHFPWPFMDVVHFVTRIDKPTLVTYHSDIVRQKQLLKLYRPLKTRFLGSMDRIVATSPNYFATSDVLRNYASKVSVIPIGLDKASYPLPDPQLQQAWHARFGAKFFLFVGVIRYYKGLHILLEAARASEYPIVIVGSGPVEKELKEQAAQFGLRNVHFLGHMPDEDKVALLSLCRAVVFPSHLRSEAFGISLLEGAMFGKPMISSEIGTGTSYINIGGETGLVVPPNDPRALHEAMRYLWEHPEQAAQMGARGEERYWKYFTAATMARSYVDLYSDLVRRHRAAA
nr:glycosyltransferase family 4 protein [uncultured Noviherbaspirillum sp.]